jgi:hypothetical protein
LQHVDGLPGDLGANPVTGQGCDVEVH